MGSYGMHSINGHLRTIKLGIDAHAHWHCMVQPQIWDERSTGAKTDRLEPLSICQHLDRFVRGKRKACGGGNYPE